MARVFVRPVHNSGMSQMYMDRDKKLDVTTADSA
jgi:hypothetical protein